MRHSQRKNFRVEESLVRCAARQCAGARPVPSIHQRPGQRSDGEADHQEICTAQHSLCEWTRRWGMAFNGAKCHVMRLGLRNPGHAYYMNSIRLDASEKERDVDVTISSSLKPAQQCKKAAQTASAVLAQIIRAFHCRDRHVFLSLYQQCQSYFWPQGHNLRGEAQRTGDAQPTGEED